MPRRVSAQTSHTPRLYASARARPAQALTLLYPFYSRRPPVSTKFSRPAGLSAVFPRPPCTSAPAASVRSKGPHHAVPPARTGHRLSGAHPGCLIRAPSICAHHTRLRIYALPASPHTPPKKRREAALFPLYSAAAAWYTAAVIRRGAGARRLRCSAMPLRTLDLIRVMPA